MSIASELRHLDPEWIFSWDGPPEFRRGRIIGIKFTCPVDDGDGPHREGHSVAVLFANPPDGGPAHPADPNMIGDNAGKRWRCAVGCRGDAIGSLSIEPSIDCTRSDAHCWHGHVRNGRIV